MDYASVGWNDREISKSGLAPAEERVTLFVALEFQQGVHVEGVAGAEFVYLDRVVDHQFNGLQGINQRRITAQLFHGVTHGGEVDHAGDSGEILQEDATGSEGNF